MVLPPGTVPPQSDDGLIAAERAVFAAISHRDSKALAALIAPDFVVDDRNRFLDVLDLERCAQPAAVIARRASRRRRYGSHLPR